MKTLKAIIKSGASEKIAIVVGRVDSSRAGGIHGNANESEDIKTVILPAQEFVERVRCGKITDLKTLVAGYWFAEHRQALYKLGEINRAAILSQLSNG